MQDAVIIDCLRTPVGKAPRGTFRHTRPDDLAATVVRRLIEKYPQVPQDEIEDLILGCAMPEGEAGNNMARNVALRAGLPDTVTGSDDQSLLQLGSAIDRNGGRSHSLRQRAHHARGRQRIDEHDPDGRQQARAKPMVHRAPAANLHEHGAHGGAVAAPLRHHARGRRTSSRSQS